MKSRVILFLTIVSLLFLSCDKNEYVTVKVATPEYMTIDAFRSSVKITAPISIVESGKIYVYNNLVLVNDIDKGIHIIDNSDPGHPQKIAFISLKANKDMEIKGDYLYADSLMDLVVFDISDVNNIKEVNRLKDVFPRYIILPFIEDLIFDNNDYVYNPDEILVSWTISEERRRIEEVDYSNIGILENDVIFANTNSATGQGGSLARFKIVNDILYAVDSHNINLFNITNLDSPIDIGKIYAGFDIETIFNKEDHLFLGSMSGMYIYDISKPTIPEFVSEFQHGTACDPVVVDNEFAYITLRAGNFCGALESSLLIVDISDLYNPSLKKSYAMDNPYGLGIKDNLLFICDGTSGLKVYNKTDVDNLVMLNHFKDINTFDVIPLEERLLMIGKDVLYQYTYGDDGINLLSQFSLN